MYPTPLLLLSFLAALTLALPTSCNQSRHHTCSDSSKAADTAADTDLDLSAKRSEVHAEAVAEGFRRDTEVESPEPVADFL